ncbi:MarR family winged helix-turn-helix transcriptional regulator [Crossiella cryophila]|uniref:DNA-binding MarR family transcriptional regulator n=1 Tax=Crossiella cryophila TaxID=43355 RepID=A0A7W7CAR3_9PSEU|nr:MarR family transcriptional regulator [Crossiella cryophila]MBB4677681.1 DNA-binding MarR family transcriptional regulator [Crossiella cryophila]
MLANDLINQEMTATLHADGLTPARAKALWTLAPLAPITQRALADALAVTPRNVTTLVDALEESGFVTRGAHPEDRRAIAVDLTVKGRTAIEHMRDSAAELADALFGALPPAELALVTRVLHGVAGYFAAHIPGPAD